jgi:hypothetical protein
MFVSMPSTGEARNTLQTFLIVLKLGVIFLFLFFCAAKIGGLNRGKGKI